MYARGPSGTRRRGSRETQAAPIPARAARLPGDGRGRYGRRGRRARARRPARTGRPAEGARQR
ncbi:MAG: hypothetical protein GEV11_29335 [Streptosporangiales bacterium]|nr:hypothetical protein [Streptosporangiales bacterium]